MAVGDYVYEFKTLTFGSGTSYIVEEVEGLIGLPDVRTNDEDKQEDHGQHRGVDLLAGRHLIFVLNIIGIAGTDIEDKIRAAITAFQVSKRLGTQEYKLFVQRPGREKLFIECRARRMAFPSDFNTARGLAKGGAELKASDPRYYSDTEKTTFVDIANTAVQGQSNITMSGDFVDGVEPILEIVGPATNPRIQNQADNNRTVRVDVDLSATDTLLIDSKKKTVTLNGVDRYDIVRTDNQWWVLLPGVNTVLYSRSVGAASSRLTVRHHDAYISV